MEPEALNEQLKICAKMGNDDVETEIITFALTSIAISLKRIADKLELSQKQPMIISAEEAMKYDLMKKTT